MTRMSVLATGTLLLLANVGCQLASLPRGDAVRVAGVPKVPASTQESVAPPQPDAAAAPQPSATTAEPPTGELPPPESSDLARPSPQPSGIRQKLPEATPAERLKSLVEELDPAQAGAQAETLALGDVVLSVVETFPLIRMAEQEGEVAAGEQLAALSAFDRKLLAETMNMPQGYYQNYRHLLRAEQATWMGGTVYGQYRLGDGSFQPWYGNRETNEGGEFKVGTAMPLLRGREIDERRAEISKADIMRAAVEPVVQQQTIESVRVATHMYWSWVAAGQAYMVTRELLNVAQERNQGIARQVELGNLPQTELQQNERLIASREAKLVETQRKLQASAIKLSLFYRDEAGDPRIPSPAQLPDRFPRPTPPDAEKLPSDIEMAMSQRPELRDIALQRQAVDVDLRQAENDFLPNLDAVVEASKDVGAAASSKGDKTPFELQAGLIFDVPLQRSKARGKMQSAQGKATQLALKREYTRDKITSEVQDAISALQAAYERSEQTRRSVVLARQLVNAEYRSFELGNSDVLRIAIQEGAELDAQLLEIEALLDYFQAEADYRAALGEVGSP